MQPEVAEKLERTKALSEIRMSMRELYFNYDKLSDDDAEKHLDMIQGSVQNIRAKVQERRATRGNPNPPTPIPPER